MKILAVDDELLMLEALKDSIHDAAPDAEVFAFRRAAEALSFAETEQPDVAFLDIRMRGMDGLELARSLMKIYPELNVVFCTSYDEYVAEAFRDVRCNGYITKPVDAEQIRNELSHLRVPMQQEKKEEREHRVFFRCLGRFEAFVDNEPIKFESAKTKELLAFLVNACGGICGNQEIIVNLWEDDYRHDSYLKKIRKDMMDTLEKLHCDDIIFRQRGGIGINTDKVDCDYYNWKAQNVGQKPGEYMTQYSWATIPEFEW